ncbi:response regulator [Pedobacter yulinensis]|uniref:Response regulator n=1 Tax=Pedobacter yulinensis TaxID=2126353 RepID=A0A2T3HK30_9SPHI|nr:response regulator [Pedobacter yulinensis]PST82797.1 response regulator [Pedobacter yulinensis]
MPEEPALFDLHGRPPRILLVEDDPALSEILSELFADEGLELACLSETTDIIPAIEQFCPDLVLLDYLLPLTNGGELCSQIKNHSSTRTLPVIIYSAFPRLLMSIGGYGCDRFLEKPFDLKNLLCQVREVLAGKRQLF